MKHVFFDRNESLYDITERYSEATELLLSMGFDMIKDENARKSFGKAITLEAALKLKKINIDTFEKQLLERIEHNDGTKPLSTDSKEVIHISGVLPCPVRVPLMEAFTEWIEKQQFGFRLEYELKAASVGVTWLEETIREKDIDTLPDVFISAGFDLFFDKELFGKYKADNLFEDLTNIDVYHKDFNNESLSLQDPKRQYSIVGVVPAVFLINKDELGDRLAPQSWADLLSDEFANSVSLPIGDFDLFNAILLNIYKNYGEEGVKKLGKTLQKSMHPSEMVKSHMKKNQKPAVTIMPYFFTWMAKEGGPMMFVWPSDGAIISPIFMLSKKEKKDLVKPIVNFFASKEVGEILAHNGKFPSVHPNVDNQIPSKNQYMWIGWDFIEKHDITALIKHCEQLFELGVKGE